MVVKSSAPGGQQWECQEDMYNWRGQSRRKAAAMAQLQPNVSNCSDISLEF